MSTPQFINSSESHRLSITHTRGISHKFGQIENRYRDKSKLVIFVYFPDVRICLALSTICLTTLSDARAVPTLNIEG